MHQRELHEYQKGWRANAGRKPSPHSGMPHLTRDRVKKCNPMHITAKVREDVPNMRSWRLAPTIIAAIKAGSDRFGCRAVEFSLQRTHLHLIVEAGKKGDVAKFMIGLGVRIAKAINSVVGRIGSVFADRYHRTDLLSLQQVRNTIRYVLCNANKHGETLPGKLDPFSSAFWFKHWLGIQTPLESNSPVAQATNWKLLNWRSRYGPIDPDHFLAK